MKYPVLALAAMFALIASPALAETKTKDPATKTAPAAPAPAKTTAPVAAKVNLNTATATELDALPQIGPARAKAIIEGRAKGKYKDWDDFITRHVVPTNASAAIKDLVTF